MFSDLIVVTDGIIALPDIHVLDSVLTQLHTNAVAVSFLHVGSQFHPHCSQGQVPYSELMQFIACATLGAYIPSAAVVVNILLTIVQTFDCLYYYYILSINKINLISIYDGFLLTLSWLWCRPFLTL